ncbi:uncharacterized protein (DUF305 family) [Mycolicibacterium sp. 624]
MRLSSEPTKPIPIPLRGMRYHGCMKLTTARVVALTSALATALFVSACSSPPASDGHADQSHHSETSAAAQGANFNDADVVFATDMIPHHQQAIELSALVPERSSDPALVELAAAISGAQKPEMEALKVFLVQWRGGESTESSPDPHAGHDMGSMDGMVDGPTMAKLETLRGAEFDTLWLQSMIGHHEGAITMANTEIADGANTDAKALAKQIVTAQQTEIDQMKQMLGA